MNLYYYRDMKIPQKWSVIQITKGAVPSVSQVSKYRMYNLHYFHEAKGCHFFSFRCNDETT